MLASFERLRVANALMLTEETFRSRHRLELKYILGSFCERFSKKCGHASLSAEILHNLLSLRSRSPRPRVNRRTLAVSIPSLLVYPLTAPRQFDMLQSDPGWRGSNEIRSTETARVHHAAWRCGRVAACGARAAAGEAAYYRVLGRRHAFGLEPLGRRVCPAATRIGLDRRPHDRDRVSLGGGRSERFTEIGSRH